MRLPAALFETGHSPVQRAKESAGRFDAAWIVCAALALMVAPTLFALAQTTWRDPSHSHGPIVLAIAIWLFASRFRRLRQDPLVEMRPSPAAGWPLVVVGSALHAIGRSQDFMALEVLAVMPVLLGCTLLFFGPAPARRMWFAFVFVLFLVPLPGSIVDAITQPLKIAVSQAAEAMLHAAGYPVGRAGVTLTVGPYMLLVADACAGLNSLFVLEAFGLLYLNVVQHASAFRNVAMTLLVLPVSFAANVVRVTTLALVTFHFGDAAGRGFVHQFSGILLLVCALLLLIAADGALRGAVAWRRPRAARTAA